MKKKYAIVKTTKKLLRANMFWNDWYAGNIGSVFREGIDFLYAFKIELMRYDMQNSGGYGGGNIDLDWEGKWIYIGYQFDDRELDERARVTKNTIFSLIDKYYILLQANPEHIVLCRDDNYNLWFETELPEFEANEISQEERYVLHNPPDDKL